MSSRVLDNGMNSNQEEASSQGTATAGSGRRGTCSSCLQVRGLNSNGFLRKHNNCPGSGCPPVGSDDPQPTEAPQRTPIDLIPSDDIIKTIKATATKTLPHIPKAARPHAAGKLTDLLKKVNEGSTILDAPPTIKAWHNLLLFGNVCLAKPARGGKSLASMVIKSLRNFPRADNTILLPHQHKSGRGRPNNRSTDSEKIRDQVSKKIEEGNTVGAIRIITSEDTIAPRDAATAQALRDKHPSRETIGASSSNTTVPNVEPLFVQESEVYKAIMSFPSGSAGGYTGIRPQHLKEMVNPVLGESGEFFLSEITRFVNNALAGLIPDRVKPFFFGASLCALKKKDGGIRPIAVGNTLRRLVAKAAVRSIRTEAARMLQPNQLGFGVPLGSEAAAHAARAYINNLPEENAVLKLDFKNAFNLLKRDVVLTAVRTHLPSLYPFVSAGYSEDSMLLFGEHEITSSEGVQQGDPLAPFLFCIAVREITVRLTSELNIWFLDDGTLAGPKESLLADLELVVSQGPAMGLVLNPSKCEIISSNQQAIDAVRSILPGASLVEPTNSILLGAPLGTQAIDEILENKVEELRRMEQRIGNLDTHDALYLLTKCLSLPRLTYFLRCAPSYDNAKLKDYDSLLRSIFTRVLNLTLEDVQWDQATLPVRLGGIGIRKASQIALPAFLSSCVASSQLVAAILPEHLKDNVGVQDPHFITGATRWDTLTGSSAMPVAPQNYKQSHWDGPVVENIASTMFESVSGKDRARLLAVRAPHAGDFLLAVPNSSLGTRLDPQTIRIGVALRLAAPILAEHRCICGSALADQFGYHGLVCRRSEGKIARHEEVNNIIRRSLATAGCPAIREPQQLCRSDGTQKRPDGITLQAWANGKQVVWDYTCASTLADTYLQYSRDEGGAAATFRESQKCRKYSELSHHYMFVPIGSETLGSWGKCASKFLKELGKRLIRATKDPRAASFLFQRLSVAIQRGNACCILGTRPSSEAMDEVHEM